ncbi:hypothetical protein C6N75_19505 [Streptomyces solincola]|uniref:VWFA domain-containing protein n=1 Tax=Streptomyces solincola TaxID=2100817 RepID=A0A2S9PT79_9ACTN|nr:VWA domain-containing protein [Streptomyces solincola]PRH77593.1 hypothetical protein C6N75_19505 [Streptomyces solincola]
MGIRSLLRKVFGRDRAETDETATASVPPQTERAVPGETAAAPQATDADAAPVEEPAREESRPDTPEPGAGGEGSGADRPADEPTGSEQEADVEGDADTASEAEDDGRPADAAGRSGGTPKVPANAGTGSAARSSGGTETSAAPAASVPAPASASPQEESAADLVAASFDNPRPRRAQVPAARDEAVPAKEQAKERETEPKAAGIPAQSGQPAARDAADTEPEPATKAAEAAAAEKAAEAEQATEAAAENAPATEGAATEDPATEDTAKESPATKTPAKKTPAKKAAAKKAPAKKAPAKRATKATEAAKTTKVTEAAAAAESAEAAPGRTSSATSSDSAAEKAAGKPAVTLARVKSRAPQLAEAYKAAGAALRKQGLTGARATVYLVLDRSGSMRPFYKDGSAQHLAEQALALAAHLDERATVPVVFFSTEVDGTAEVSLDEVEGRIEALNDELGRMGRTHYEQAVEEVRRLHAASDAADGPALVVFQTDGAPESRTAATKALAEAAEQNPRIAWRFVAFGEQDAKAFDYLRKLEADGTEGFGFFHAGPAPAEVPHASLYRELLADWTP